MSVLYGFVIYCWGAARWRRGINEGDQLPNHSGPFFGGRPPKLRGGISDKLHRTTREGRIDNLVGQDAMKAGDDGAQANAIRVSNIDMQADRREH
jgi:hypothetical protein